MTNTNQQRKEDEFREGSQTDDRGRRPDEQGDDWNRDSKRRDDDRERQQRSGGQGMPDRDRATGGRPSEDSGADDNESEVDVDRDRRQTGGQAR